MPVIALSGHPLAAPPAFVASADLQETALFVLDLDAGALPAGLAAQLPRAALIRIAFPGFADGRGFSLARRLRDLGYRGRLRACGCLIPDQRAALIGCGFDEVELPAPLLQRQGGKEVWQRRADAAPLLQRLRASAA